MWVSVYYIYYVVFSYEINFGLFSCCGFCCFYISVSLSAILRRVIPLGCGNSVCKNSWSFFSRFIPDPNKLLVEDLFLRC